MNYRYTIAGAFLAVAITATMDFTGYTMFSALPLLGLSVLFILLEKFSRKNLALRLGKWRDYGYALLYPLTVLPVMILIAYLFGELNPKSISVGELATQILIPFIIGTLVVLLTEEGFFRSWLWASIGKKNNSNHQILLATTFVFVIWHISAVTSGSSYSLPGLQVPIFLVNVFLLGYIWGLMRLISGSVIVPSLSHALWNALAYEFFGFGEKTGALGIVNTKIFGPEVGILGIVLNTIFLLFLRSIAKKEKHLQ